jgi:hypothetical protein
MHPTPARDHRTPGSTHDGPASPLRRSTRGYAFPVDGHRQAQTRATRAPDRTPATPRRRLSARTRCECFPPPAPETLDRSPRVQTRRRSRCSSPSPRRPSLAIPSRRGRAADGPQRLLRTQPSVTVVIRTGSARDASAIAPRHCQSRHRQYRRISVPMALRPAHPSAPMRRRLRGPQ